MDALGVPKQTPLEKRLEKLVMLLQDESKIHQIVDQLRQLGIFLQTLFPEACKNSDDFQGFFNRYCFDNLYNVRGSIYNPLIYWSFKAVWKEDLAAYPSKRKYQLYKVKACLTKSTRHHIHLGLLALNISSLDKFRLSIQPSESSKLKKKIIYYDALITQSIAHYNTTWQTLLRWTGKGLASGMGIACGLVTFSAMARLLMDIRFSLMWASAVGIIACLANNQLFSPAISEFLLDLLGRDQLGSRFVSMVNSEGHRTSLSFIKKLSLLGAFILALSAGIGYSMIIYENLTHLVEFLPYAHLVAPYLIIPLSTVAAICTMTLLFKAVADLLKYSHWKSAFSKPFEEIRVCFNPNTPKNQGFNSSGLKIGKWLSYGIILILIAITTLGLVTLCSVSQQTLLKMLLNQGSFFSLTTLQSMSYSIISMFFLAKFPFVCISTIRTAGICIAPTMKYLIQGFYLGSQTIANRIKHVFSRAETFQLEVIKNDGIVPHTNGQNSAEDETVSYETGFKQDFKISFCKAMLFKYMPAVVNATGHGALMFSPSKTCFDPQFSMPFSVAAGILSFCGIIGRKETQVKAREHQRQATSMRQEKVYQQIIQVG